MKKQILAALTTAAMLITGAAPASLAEENTDPFAGKDEVNIVYLGGSITQGAGVSDKSQCWASRIGEYFKEKYPDKTINNYNEGIGGTGSDMGIMRLERDVLSRDPDYVFIEFAVNDIGKTAAARHMESIVRSLCELDEVPYVTFVYTAKYDSSNKRLQNNSEAHHAVAEYYGIPEIDMKPALEESILSTGTMEDEDNVKKWLVDLTHPTADGYDTYTKTIQAALETGDCYARPQQKTAKLDINASPLSTKWTAANGAKATGTWSENENASYGCGLTSSTPGDTLEFTFSGPVLGIQHRIGKECGQYTLNIDGRDVGTIDTYYSKTTSQGVLGYQNFALGAGEHRVKITVLGTKNENIADGTVTPVAFDWFVAEQNPSPYRWINENFEDCDFSRLVPSGDMSYEWSTDETALGSNGAMKVTLNGKNAAGPSWRCETVNGTTYNVSAWVKAANIDEWTIGENSDKVRFVFQPKALNEDGSWGRSECYTEYVVMESGITSGEWVKLTAQYVCDGKGKQVGVTDRVAASDISRVEIRVGSGNAASATGSEDVPAILYIDDFKVEPESIDPVEETDPGNIIENGSFENADMMDSWTNDGKASVEYAEGGANGTSGAALVKGTAEGQNSVGIKQKSIPVRANRAYKVSYWVKAANDAALGAYPQMIVEYKGKQTDPSAGSTTYYPNYDMCATYKNLPALTNEWQKVEFIYKKDGVTNDICIYPSMYIRLYSSEGGGALYSGDHPEFYIDEIRMDELDIVYDGDFAVDPASQAISTTTKYQYPWAQNGNTTGLEWIQDADADGTNSYISYRQSGMNELQTYVDLEEGETYRLSLYARLDNWETQAASALKDSGLYITAILNKARGDLNETYTSQYQYLPCSSTGETDIQRWMLSDEWQHYECEFTVSVQQSGAKHRNGYMSFRLGTGGETATYSLDGVKIEKVSTGSSPIPALSNARVDGEAVKDMPVTASVDYSCSSDCAAYIWRASVGDDETGYIEKAYEETAEPGFTYTPDASDVGKKLRFEVRAVANNGEYSNIVYADAGVVAESPVVYETSAEAAFETESWTTRLEGTVTLTAGEGGASFMYALAVYGSDGEMESVEIENKTLEENTTEKIELGVTVPRGASEAKIMVWDADMKPYCPAAVIAK